MNSAIRAVVRTGLFVNCRVFYVYDGFRGLVDNRVQEATWESATSLIQKGGSVLGVAPCEEFKTREGRLKGAKTLVLHGINNLIVIGGGGSMEGLQTFKQEWRSLVQELVSKGLVPDNMGRPLQDLGVCGIPCAVTNDIWGTEMTLGADSALTRVIDSVDHVEASLNSSQRVFIVEVLGKHCGFLAMTAGLAVEADFVFVPEWPPVTEWRDALTDKLQRMALRREDQKGVFVALRASLIERGHLGRAVEKTLEAEKAYRTRDYERCVQLRGSHYSQKGRFLDQVSFPPREILDVPDHTFLVVHCGSPTAGMNAATHALVRVARYNNCRVMGVSGGFPGFAEGNIKTLEWGDVIGWVSEGGSALGTSRQLVSDPDRLAAHVLLHNIRGIAIIGGFEAFQSALMIRDWRDEYDSFRIPIVVVPATISNNVPGVVESLGSDTALNEICRNIDNIKQSARGTKKRAFIVEVQGENSGYLATIGAIATGADNAHIYEEKMRQEDLAADVDEARRKLERGCTHYVLLRTNGARAEFSSEQVKQVFEQAGKGKFSTRLNYLGHSVQGASRFGAKAFERMFSHSRRNTADIELLGVRFGDQAYADVGMLETLACFVHTNVRNPWWLTTHGLMRVLATQEKYMAEAIPPERSCNAKNYQTSAGQQPEFIGR
ncbi:unnamed protein product, partial [Mesorhabditis spiculigera]